MILNLKMCKKAALLGAAGLFAAALTAPVQAATLDFVGFANENEQGVESGTAITSAFFGGETITFSANSSFDPYFDSGQAGLGVCQNSASNPGPVFTGQGTTNKCLTGAADDNVTVTESVTISWSGPRTLSNLLFTGEWHGGSVEYLHLETSDAIASANGSPEPRADKTLLFGVNGGSLGRYSFLELSGLSFEGVTSATFAFDDDSFLPFDDRSLSRDAEQFYLASANISAIPVPAAGVLLLTALGGLGLARRRKRAA